ncbi:MAG: ATP-binding cassette domain-containing protein, partial [Nostocoides sp.]
MAAAKAAHNEQIDNQRGYRAMPSQGWCRQLCLPYLLFRPHRTSRQGKFMVLRSGGRTDAAGPAPGQSARIEISGLTKRFMTPSGEPFTALRDVSLTIEPGQFCAIVGPTGCGKSTTLGLVSGLDRPSAGSVRVG